MFVVYALYSPKHQKIYIGYSSNIIERFRSHNELATKGYTLKYRPWKLVYQEKHEAKADAMKREKQLKSAKGRESIWNIILDNY